MKRTLFLHFRKEWFLFLSPAFVIVHGFARYPEAIDWVDAVWLFGLYSVVSWLLAVLLQGVLLFRKAALFSFTLVLFNSVFGSLYEPLLKLVPGHFVTRMVFLFPLVLVLFALLFWYLKRTRRRFERPARFLNLLFVLLLALEIVFFTGKVMKWNDRIVATKTCDSCTPPDIYLIVTDGYAGRKQLREYLHFNNTLFEDSLRALGFHLVDSSTSNYGATNVSMASLLNMTYGDVGEGEDPHALINRSSVVLFFEKMGYRIANYSIFKFGDQFPEQPTVYFPVSDRLITAYTFLAYLKRFIKQVLLKGTEGDSKMALMQGWSEGERKRDSITMQNLLADAAKRETTPKFVYAHFMMPHPPFLFDSSGGSVDTSATNEIQYVSYLKYSNKKLLQAVKEILERSAIPPIILLVSDHGYRDDSQPTPTPWRFSNLLALYLPDKKYTGFYRGLSNVNLFRVLLNQQFKQQLPLLPDSTVH